MSSSVKHGAWKQSNWLRTENREHRRKSRSLANEFLKFQRLTHLPRDSKVGNYLEMDGHTGKFN